MLPIEFIHVIQPGEEGMLCDVLSIKTELSKSRIKRAMTSGAVWLRNPGSKMRRVRRATTTVRSGDRIAIYYDESILNLQPIVAQCLRDNRRYSIWLKPAGLMTQGSPFGDHCALTRQVQHYFKPQRAVFLIHRIDRETTGLVIIAHDRKAAALFTELFKNRRIEKRYQAVVTGNMAAESAEGFIDAPIDGRSAQTKYHLLHYDQTVDQSCLRVEIITGRRHQIRRHFESIGHPVVGDPIYGHGNKNNRGLQLVAYGLTFTCPFGNGVIDVEIDPGNGHP
jgi:tRNA pseudouridine32 synthase/23S rRNA pseudouridine746 synthase